MHITTTERQMLDGSSVHDVSITYGSERVRFACIDVRAADAFAEDLERLIERHTVHNTERSWRVENY